MEMPKPPTEIADMGKKLAGTWKCTGTMMVDPADPTKMGPMKATITNKLDADKAWILGAVGGLPFKLTMMTTYDTLSKKWYRLYTDNIGGSETAWATVTGNKTVWEGDARGMNIKPWKSRLTEETVSDKEIKMTGESNMDGKTWMKNWEATCKK